MVKAKEENRNPNGKYIRKNQALQRYNLGWTLLRKLARKYDAIIRPSERVTLIDTEKFERGLENEK